ncbi:MAG: DUF5069 domain-containing protein [Verrucomicrobiales bacterium]|nr:DUF5069 domain-containing protein [Verrucomicrobiales bacterium]
MKTTDLTQRPPRSPRVRLGGFTILPRVIDKARATVAGTQGEYKFGNPLDTLLFGFAGVEPGTFLAKIREGAGDREVLEWFAARARKSPHEIAAWSTWTESYVENDVESREWLTGRIAELDPRRTDIGSLFDYLDLDDYRSFGGQA